ncbi:phosphoenolpyruvate carboxykinase (ATP) [Deferrisoma camini]|uniref:phosphoenolpyruvate carboxykinase (ATP) n=1 Tax=Deferrisoma camini TaxID=1035120 RepID=UPI0004A22466|nr:phosphoenolpyruvate carboxykinase (ATP) [Deferrisoma camini]
MDPRERLDQALHTNDRRIDNPDRRRLIADALEHREAIPLATGALATWTRPESTGRSPKDTYIVRRPESEATIDWDSPNCIPMDPETFDMLWEDACRVLGTKDRVYVTDRVVGADSAYALPVRTVTPRALTALFSHTMFRPVPEDIGRSVFADRPFVLLSLPEDKVEASRYEGRLRRLPDGRTSDMAIVMDFDRRLGLVYGSAYCGTNKKLMFTVMNYLLPEAGVLPLHCSANEGRAGDCALLLGLSGTGKTTLSADPSRALLGDDEHGWSDRGIANFEFGCYAKLINLRQDKEPEIWHATFHEADPLDHGAIVENLMVYPDGTFDVDDDRLTPNSRVAYPLSFLSNIKTPPVSGHPTTILFLAADANGVLPPVARLDKHRAMFWFLMGYTSKLAGTETGIKEPVSTFSRFFGAPFMPRNPEDYARMLGEKLDRHGTRVYLVNTGWSGGPYGVGQRMDIALTRAVVNAALAGQLEEVPYEEDPLFHLAVPRECPGVPSEVLIPRNTWPDPAAYDERARRLAEEFRSHFESAYGGKGIAPAVAAQCPGR